MTAKSVVETQSLTVAYGSKLALAGVTLEVPAGSVYALLGRNGAGKSTLVRNLLGFERAQGGWARLFGLDAWRQRTRTMARVGFVPESPMVPPGMTVQEASRFCARLSPGWDQPGLDARLGRLGLDSRLPFSNLSRGQKTQVALALALGSQPELLILDDPTLGLDPVARRDLFREILEDLGERGTTVFLTTHDLAGVETVADRVGILHEGHLLVDEAMENLKDRYRKIHCGTDIPPALLAGLGPVARHQGAFGLEITVGSYHPEALAAAGLDGQAVLGASLEDIFLATVTGGVQS
jgi:ABC-2 type transport system ATP-binding protein